MSMVIYDPEYLEQAHRASIFHKTQIVQSDICGCFYCLGIFYPDGILEWTDQGNSAGETAWCPLCTMDTVIGSASGFPVTDRDFLIQMNAKWFSSDDDDEADE